MVEPPFWDRLWDFATTVADGWSFWIGFLLTIEPYLEGAAPKTWKQFRDHLSRWWPHWRPRLFRAAGIIAILVSCFQAWDYQYLGRLKAEQNASAAFVPEYWPSLSKDEKEKLIAALKLIPSQTITVACETLACKALSDDLVDALNQGGWNANVMHSGGIGITGTTGISLDPNETGSRNLKEAIEQTTNLKITIGPDRRQDYGSDPEFLVVGTKPF